MVKFTFVVHDETGLHIQLAGAFVKEAVKCSSNIKLKKGDKIGDAKKIFNVMGLSIKSGEEVEVMVEGENEQQEADFLKSFTEKNM